MNIPTIDQALAALDANPEAARAFEKSRAIESPGLSRRAAVAQTLEALRAKRAATASAAATGDLKARARQAAAELERAAAALKQRKAAAPAPKPAPAKPATIAKPASRFAGAADALVKQAAVHRSSPAADRIEARAELEKRGFSITPEGIVSRSIRGGRAFKKSLKS